MDQAVPSLSPSLPRAEALARAAELDAAYRRSARDRGEELIPLEHLTLGASLASRDGCPACRFPLLARERLAWRKLGNGAHVVTHSGCWPVNTNGGAR